MISSAYSYYLTQYASQSMTKHDYTARKPSDIRRAYNKLQSINRSTPTYKTDTSIAAQKYAIDLKENARELSSVANELSDSSSNEMIIRQTAESDNPDFVSATYTGKDSSETQSFVVEVQQLALPQINSGNYLPPNSKLLAAGDYSFDLNMSDITYEFEFSVSDNDTSQSVQERLSRLINRSNIGLKADVRADDMGNTALTITSNETGTKNFKPTQFDIHENPTAASANTSATDILGLSRVTQYPANAFFSIDGESKSASTNRIRLANSFELTFKQPTEDTPVTISLKTDSNSVVESISELVDGYNNLLAIATDENNTFDGTSRLRRHFASLTQVHHSMLEQSGLDINDNGSITVNTDKVRQLVATDSLNTIFESLGKFKTALQDTAEKIAMNPMDYVNNKIIAYKNPHRPTTDPYNQSAYTGMMFNGYI